MQLGDTKKAVVLAIVALIILGAGVFELLPKAKAAAAAPTPGTVSDASAGTAPAASPGPSAGDLAALPKNLLSNPFAKIQAKAEQESVSAGLKPAKGGRPPRSQASPGPIKGELPPYDPAVGQLPPVAGGAEAPAAGNPGENAGNSQKKEEKNAAMLSLVGVVRVARWTAFFETSDKDAPEERALGSKIGGYTITDISETKVALKKGKSTTILTVGGKPVKL